MQITEDREQILTQLGVNFVVEAGAGTGKTTLLIERLCFALLVQNIAAPRLVALTFTEKAAAEIKTRLVFQLQAIAQTVRQQKLALEKHLTEGANPTETEKELLMRFLPEAADAWQKRTRRIIVFLEQQFETKLTDILERSEKALAQLDRSQIGTIHSFCADILRTYPLEAGLTPNAEIDRGPRARRIFETQWNRFLDTELGEDAPRAELWKEVLKEVSLRDLYNCAWEMCSGKISHYNFWTQKENLSKVLQEHAAQAEALSKRFEKGQKKPRVIERALQQAARRFSQSVIWLNKRILPVEHEQTIKINSIPSDWDKESATEAKILCSFAEQADPSVQNWILKAYELLQNFNEKVRSQYAEEGILSFDDLISKTRDLLQHNLLVRRLVQEEYDALYIDEFQDTDPAQGEILLYLAEQKGRGATTWQEVKLTPGKLFVVGDPKQSIYHFRGADITAYQLFTNLILSQGGKKAYLRQNFRSEPGIIALANEIGEKVMLQKAGFQPGYEPIFTNKEQGNACIEMHLVGAGEGALADDYRHNQAELIAGWIKENVGKFHLKDGRLLQCKDIAILTRAGTTLWPYTDALRRAGIAFSVEEDKEFYRRQEVSDFLNLLRVLQDPQDKISLVGVLRSPLGGLIDEEVYQLAQRNELDFRRISIDVKAERLFAWLRHFSIRVGREPLVYLLRSILQETFLSEACAVAYDGERSIESLQRLVTLAEGYSLSTPATLGQFLSRVQELMEQELSKLTASNQGEIADAVEVMTVHKSKGLEFPVVILVDISKKEVNNTAKRPAHLYSWRYDLHGFRIGKYADMNLAWLEEQEQTHSRCEEIRVLYVALTRAKEKLLLVGNQIADDTSMAGLFMRAGLFPALQEQGTTPPAKVGACGLAVQYTSYVSPEKFIYKFPASLSSRVVTEDLAAWRRKENVRLQEYKQYKEASSILAPSALAGDNEFENEQAMQLGSLVHEILAHCSRDKALDVENVLQQRGVLPGELLYQDVLSMLKAFEHSVAYQQLTAMQVLGTELPFSLYNNQEVVSGVIDLLSQDKDGIVWVIDYKTDKVKPGMEQESAQKYTAQLSVYAQAAQRLYPSNKVQSAVVFVRNGIVIKL